MEAPIVFGLKRPASEGLVAGAGTGLRSDRDGTAVAVAALCVAAVGMARRSSGWLASWAAARSISPTSLSGISLLLALCAGAWFSGGAHDGAKGMIAMLGWLLVLVAASGLAGKAGSPGATTGAGTAAGFGWLSAVCAAAAECAIYGGMAAGSQPTILIGIWPLAVTTVILIATSELLGASWRVALGAVDPAESGRTADVRRWTSRLLSLPAGLRGLLALLAFGVAGAPAALFAVLALEVVSVVTVVAMLGKITPARWWTGRPVAASAISEEPGLVWPAAARPGAARPVRVTAIVGVAGSPGSTAAVRLTAVGTRGAAARGEGSAARSPAGSSTAAGPSRSAEASGSSGQATAQDVILALRDDGAVARWAGRLVQGNLIPLPPAIAGLVATAMLAALGLRSLPGFIALTPPVVMLLAAPGSSHRHDGRFDSLVPVLLALAQYVYLATLGFALDVPKPVVFCACALILVWYASVIAGGAGPAHGAFLGWETRMLAIGLAAALGLATFGYLCLATYLGVLIGRKVMAG